jgi:hypothetical protein
MFVARLRLKNGQASNSRHEGCGSYKLPPGKIAHIVRIHGASLAVPDSANVIKA